MEEGDGVVLLYMFSVRTDLMMLENTVAYIHCCGFFEVGESRRRLGEGEALVGLAVLTGVVTSTCVAFRG